MVQATTPTFVLTLPAGEVDLTLAHSIYFTIRQGCTYIKKERTELSIDSANIVSVYLTQNDTLSLTKGFAELQLNWTYDDGVRACSEIKTIPVTENLLKEVIA